MSPPSASTGRFEPAMVAGLDEPVRRYFTHALADGAPLSRGVRLDLSGRIRVGAWLRFSSVWEGDGRSFSWQATAGLARIYGFPASGHAAAPDDAGACRA